MARHTGPGVTRKTRRNQAAAIHHVEGASRTSAQGRKQGVQLTVARTSDSQTLATTFCGWGSTATLANKAAHPGVVLHACSMFMRVCTQDALFACMRLLAGSTSGQSGLTPDYTRKQSGHSPNRTLAPRRCVQPRSGCAASRRAAALLLPAQPPLRRAGRSARHSLRTKACTQPPHTTARGAPARPATPTATPVGAARGARRRTPG